MVDAERKGQSLMRDADKKCRTVGGVFGSLFGVGSNKMDEAADLYAKAANSFKMAKNWQSAGNAFLRAAAVELKQGETHIPAGHYIDAANCFRKINPSEAIKWLLKGIDIYVDLGRFNIAARHHITAAEIYEAEKDQVSKAIEHYQQAADYYKGEEASSSANKCLLKVASLSVQQQQYERAFAIYERLASASMNTQLLRYGAKDHFFHAALCRMCVDVQDGRRAVDRYITMFPAFEETRECKLVKSLIAACEEESVDNFMTALRDYESITRLDAWHTNIVMTIKSSIREGELSEYNLR